MNLNSLVDDQPSTTPPVHRQASPTAMWARGLPLRVRRGLARFYERAAAEEWQAPTPAPAHVAAPTKSGHEAA